MRISIALATAVVLAVVGTGCATPGVPSVEAARTGVSTPAPVVPAAANPAPTDTQACPAPSQLPAAPLRLVAVECFAGGWLLEHGLYPDGSLADGVVLVRRTAPGRFATVSAGSSFDAAAGRRLTAKGVPADLVAHLVTGAPLDHQVAVDQPRAAFDGEWTRPGGGHLRLDPDGTGRWELPAQSWSLRVTPEQYLGVVRARVAAAVVTLHLVPNTRGSGRVLVSTDPSGAAPLVFCPGTAVRSCAA